MSKEKFDQKLIKLLESNPDFVDEAGALLRANVRERAWKLDHDLIKLLLKDKEVEAKFFKEIEGRWIFDNNTFVDYITDKNFFADSYTKFRNKIGLNIDGKFLVERGEVALVWPYKDCVLEGGQTREEEKRKEIFFNEILAPDEINRMFDPKVLTNWKRHTANGELDVTDIQRDNQVFMERIKSAQSSEELLDIWCDMSKDSVLNWYVRPHKPEEAEEHFIAINDVEKQKQLLAELLDKNQLYVHFSEIEDETFAVSETDKALNRTFYGE